MGPPGAGWIRLNGRRMMAMDAFMQMLANGWPLALAGFVIGALAGGWAARNAIQGAASTENTPFDPATLDALAEELQAAITGLENEESHAAQTEQALGELDEAVKRANGRLKLVSLALNQSK